MLALSASCLWSMVQYRLPHQAKANGRKGTTAGKYASQRFSASCAATPKGLLRLLSATTTISMSEVKPSNKRGAHHGWDSVHRMGDTVDWRGFRVGSVHGIAEMVDGRGVEGDWWRLLGRLSVQKKKLFG